MSWITWTAVLIAWPLLGLGLAYLFGRFTHRGEAYGNAGDLAPQVVSYLRRSKQGRMPSRTAAQTRAKREGTSGRRVH